MQRPIEAVTFDYWNTLVYEPGPQYLRDRRIDAWASILRGAGIKMDTAALKEAFDASWEAYESAWLANRQYLWVEAADDVMRTLELAPSDELRGTLASAFAGAWKGAELPLAAGAADAIRALCHMGVRVGIICDVGMTPSSGLRSILQLHGVLAHFDHCSFSDEVGVYKPDEAIFRDALAGLGRLPAARAAHVGDRSRTDVAGALAMGMVAVRYRGLYDDPEPGPEAVIVIDRHAELLPSLGLA